jgi:hypothetical protein
MPRSSAQSDFVIQAEPEVFDQPAALPRAVLRSDEATARATRWTMTYVWFVLALLAVLATVGPHLPGGE